jgi:pimeloyl-ACP methyl ester carboxylesterase
MLFKVDTMVAGPFRTLAGLICTVGVLGSSTAPSVHSIQANGVRLEYLDWGGHGPPLVFLAGLGDTPYIYNDLAPEFRSRFHCLGLTRRGFGGSAQPESGYELDNLVQDAASFINALRLRNVTVVGHSFGGTEAIRLSELHPDMIRRVVLLDTAYVPFPESSEKALATLPSLVGFPMSGVTQSLSNFREFQKWAHRNVWSDAAEANLRQQVVVKDDGSIMQRTPPRVAAAIQKDQAAWNITRIPVPALLIFAHPLIADSLSQAKMDGESAVEIRKASDEIEDARRGQIEALRRDSLKARIVEYEHTDHRCFIQRREEVVTEMKHFLN